MSIKILHFADAHIDMANFGKRNPDSGMPYRVEDFLKAFDTIVDYAIDHHVDMVIFAGDAYKDRTPVPTFQREWGKRVMRLSRAEIPTLLLVGNHDMSPAQGRAHTLQEFDTFSIPYIRVISRLEFLKPRDLFNVPVQVIGVPWISKARVETSQKNNGNTDVEDVNDEISSQLQWFLQDCLEKADPQLPVILTAHASVQGAKYGRERAVMLGKDLVLSRSLVCDPRIDYTALGHIHKPQDLNENAHPPVIYPGSIERVDMGEAADEKFFIVATIDRGHTEIEWVQLHGRKFIDRFLQLKGDEVNITQSILQALPDIESMHDAVVRLVLQYPEGLDAQIHMSDLVFLNDICFDFHLVKRPQLEARMRLGLDQNMASLSPLELLELFLKTKQYEPEQVNELLVLAKTVMESTNEELV